MLSTKVPRFTLLSFLSLSILLPQTVAALIISYEVDLSNPNPNANPFDPTNRYLYSTINRFGQYDSLDIWLPSPTDVGFNDPLPIDEAIIYNIRFANNDFIRFNNPDRTFLQASFFGAFEGPGGIYSVDPYAGLLAFYGSDENNLFEPSDVLSYPGKTWSLDYLPWLDLGYIDESTTGNCQEEDGYEDCSHVEFHFDNGIVGNTDNFQEYFVPEVDVTDFLIHGLTVFVDPGNTDLYYPERGIENYHWSTVGQLFLSDVALNDYPESDPGPVSVPEPGTLALFVIGLAGLALRRCRPA